MKTLKSNLRTKSKEETLSDQLIDEKRISQASTTLGEEEEEGDISIGCPHLLSSKKLSADSLESSIYYEFKISEFLLKGFTSFITVCEYYLCVFYLKIILSTNSSIQE